MIRVVIDTNVLVSSFFGGYPKAVIDLWKQGRIVWCLSQPIIDEYRRILERLGVHPKEVHELLSLFAKGSHCVYTAKTPSLQVVETDPDDDKFIECAVALKARIIVSGDTDLLGLGRYVDIECMPPRRFIEKVSG